MRRLRRSLSRACGPDGPPVASAVLMLLLCFLGTVDGCELLGLEPGLILRHFQVHRLFTYPVCPPDPSLLLFDLLLFILLGWRQERELGTLRYLQRAALCAMTSALLYLLLTQLFAQTPGSACGYTTVHLALLAAQPSTRWKGLLGRVIAVALPWGLLLLTSLSVSPFLLYLCGVLSGLVYAGGALSWLEWKEQKLEELEDQAVCRILARNPFVHFVPSSRTAGTLPHTDPMARDRLSRPLEPHCPPLVPAGYLQSSSGMHEATSDGHSSAGSWAQQPFIQGGAHPQNHAHAFPPWLPPGWQPDAPLTVLESLLMEEEMLRAGMQASLQHLELGAAPELVLPKSSVSALRLQQLEKMGFPTQQAVVALAATGKVEGAVSLLVEGQVGEETLVMTDGGLCHRGGPGEPQHFARLQDPHHLSGE